MFIGGYIDQGRCRAGMRLRAGKGQQDDRKGVLPCLSDLAASDASCGLSVAAFLIGVGLFPASSAWAQAVSLQKTSNPEDISGRQRGFRTVMVRRVTLQSRACITRSW